MKLATYKDGSRDGQLLVVSRDLSRAHFATATASRLQQLLDDWNFLSPQLEDLYQTLNQGKARHAFDFDPRLCMAPLPRAFQCVSGVPSEPGGDAPPMAQRSGDNLLGAHDELRIVDADRGLESGAGLALICGDIAQGTSAQAALEGVRLMLLCIEWRLPGAGAGDSGTGHDALHGSLATAFGPVAVTPDELGPAWSGGRIHLDLQTAHNGRRLGPCNTAEGMAWHFGQLMHRVARLRALRAGSIIGSGPIGVQASVSQVACGDTLRVETNDRDGASPFGAIEQRITAAHSARA